MQRYKHPILNAIKKHLLASVSWGLLKPQHFMWNFPKDKELWVVNVSCIEWAVNNKTIFWSFWFPLTLSSYNKTSKVTFFDICFDSGHFDEKSITISTGRNRSFDESKTVVRAIRILWKIFKLCLLGLQYYPLIMD